MQQVIAEADQLAASIRATWWTSTSSATVAATVVVSQVLQDLVGTNDPALHGGYLQMSLLDPHPANNLFGQFSLDPLIPDAGDFAEL